MKKTILITGCSSGFGLLSAVQFCKEYTVYASMRNLEKKDALLNAVNEVGGSVHLLQLDVTDDSSVQSAVDQLIAKEGRLDILINNAGYGVGGCFEELSEQEIRDQMETNFFGVQKVTRAVLPQMREQNSGLIINISSLAGRRSFPGLGAYHASKFALEGFSESLRYEVNQFGIKIVLVEPGAFKTSIFSENKQVASGLNRADGPYAKLNRFVEAVFKKTMEKMSDDPIHVVNLIEKIMKSKKPKLRYMIGRNAKIQYRLGQIIPNSSGLFEKLINKKIT